MEQNGNPMNTLAIPLARKHRQDTWMSELLVTTPRLLQRLVGYVLAIILTASCAMAADPGRIYVEGTKLMADGSQIYLNGANTPWNRWNEFGGSGGGSYDPTWWSNEFQRLKASGINSTRIWIACDGTVAPSIDVNGYVTGASAQFWSDVDHLMGLAATYQVYVMASMMSFDFTDQYIWDHATGRHSVIPLRWRTMFSTADRVQSMVSHYLVPFAERYASNPYLYAIDLCNEPEWIHGDDPRHGRLPWAQLQRYVGMSAAAIHRSNSKVLVTLGSAALKWNSPKYDGNFWSDAALQVQVADSEARLDVYQYHWYAWQEPYYPLLTSAAGHQLIDRPLVIGELPARGSKLLPAGTTMGQAFEFFLANGHSGHYPWTSNGVDDATTQNGSLTQFGAEALAFQQAHPTLVRHQSGLLAQTITFPAIPDQTWTGTNLTVMLAATASSGLSVSYTVTSGPATVGNATLTITGAGAVVVAADQVGNANYMAATQVSSTFTVRNSDPNNPPPPIIPLSGGDAGGCGLGSGLALLTAAFGYVFLIARGR